MMKIIYSINMKLKIKSETGKVRKRNLGCTLRTTCSDCYIGWVDSSLPHSKVDFIFISPIGNYYE